MENLPALLLGDDPVNVLGVARNLGRLGIPVYRLGADSSGVLQSRYIRSTWVSHGIDDVKDSRYVEVLNQTAHNIGKKVVLFPLSDLHVLKVSSNAGVLDQRIVPVVARSSVAEMLVNKRKFYTSLQERGIPHPTSRFPQGTDEFLEAADEIGYPVFLKPEISPLFSRKFQLKGMVAQNHQDLLRHLEKLSGSGLDVMVQEIIPGNADCMHGCAGLKYGENFLTFCYRRVREYPPKFGCGSLMTSVPNFFDKIPLERYLREIDYHGIFDAEYKLDPRDGVFKNIEINARSWWQNLHPSASGLNLIKATYDYALGRPISDQTYDEGVLWMHLYNDYFARKDAGIGMIEWVRSLRHVGEFDVWAKDDKFPMFSLLGEVFWRKASRVFRAAKAE